MESLALRYHCTKEKPKFQLQESYFKIPKMDCASEEQMTRMKLADVVGIYELQFDIPNRKLRVLHTDSYEPILKKLEALNFGAVLLESKNSRSYDLNASTENQIQKEAQAKRERKMLWQVLLINFFFFVLEMSTGLVSMSMGLVADSLDMLADTLVYALALFAVGANIARKKKIAKAAGYFQLFLAIIGLVEVIKRFIGLESSPVFKTMIIVSFLALIGNGLCLYLLQKSKSKEAHMQASMIFTSNDVIVNIGVMLAGALVYFTQSRYPDLIIGSIVFLIVANGAFKILKLSR